MRNVPGKKIFALVFSAALGLIVNPAAPLSDGAISCLFPQAQAGSPDVRFEPSPTPVVKEMLRIAQITKNDVVYDLGCGDGRIVITAALNAGAHGVGVDIDPELIAESRRNAENWNVAHLVRFRKEDIYTTDISRATVVMLFLSPEANLKLMPRLLKELKPGTRIVSHCHRMGDWQPDSESPVEEHFVYFWVIPADVSGRWRLDVSDKYAGEYSLEFRQSYQKIAASAKAGRTEMPITRAGLRGKSVNFTIEREVGSLRAPVEFTGEVEGDRITGRCQSKNQSGSWTARRIR